jgi:histidine kinase
LETEQQLIQASKMATLGEMATGVAHELNQPLSVIKTVSSFFIKKINASEAIAQDILSTMLTKVDKQRGPGQQNHQPHATVCQKIGHGNGYGPVE